MLKLYIKKIDLRQFILFFLLVAVTLSFSVKDYNFILIKEVILIIGTMLLLLLFFLEKNIKIKKIIIYPLVLMLWLVLSFIFSKFKYMGMPVLISSAVCIILLFLIVHSAFDASNISDIIILSFIPSMIIGLLQVFFSEKMRIFLVFGDRIPSTFGNPNFFGAYISIVMPFIISRFFAIKDLYYKLLLSVIFIISFILILLTGSKAALIALVAGISVFAVLSFKNFKNKIILFILLILVLLSVILFAVSNPKTFGESIFFRNLVWRGTVRMILDNLITGTGPGSFFIVFPQYRPAELMKWTYEHSYEVLYPENIFLQIGAEAGVIGLFLFVFIIYLVFKLGVFSPPEYLAGFTAILTTNFFGVDINYAPSMFLFVLIGGIIMKNDNNCFSFSPLYIKLLSVIALIYLIFVSAFWINRHISGIYTKRGIYFSKSGNFSIAIENYKSALKYYNVNLVALYFLGSSYYDAGHYENAIKIFKYVEKLAPNYVLLHYKIAKIYNEQGLYEEAIDEYKKMLKIDPYLKEALVELAYIYYNKKNRFDEAEKCLLKALEKYENDSMLLSNLGNIYFMSKRLNESIECFKKAIEIKEDKDYYYNLGCVYFTMNDSINAKLYLKKAEKLAPLDPKIKQMLQMVEKYERITGKK